MAHHDRPRRPSDTLWRTRAVRAVRGFLCRETSGASAIEFAFLVPILIMILLGIVQAGGLFFLQNNMVHVAQDTARRVSVGELTTVTAVTYAQDKLINWGVTFDVSITEPGDDVSVVITVPMANAAILDVSNFFDSGNLGASAVVRRE